MTMRRQKQKPWLDGEGEADASDNGDHALSDKEETSRAQNLAPGKQQWGEEERRAYAASLRFNDSHPEPIRRFISDVVREASLPEPWAAARDGPRWYFHNQVTGDAQWQHPLRPVFKELTTICSEVIAMSPKERSKHLNKLHAQWTETTKQDLSQWQEFVKDGKHQYFYNTVTREPSHYHPNTTVLPAHSCRLQGLALLDSPGYLDRLQQPAAPSPSGRRKPQGSAVRVRTARAIDRLILDSEQSSAESSTSEAGRKGMLPQGRHLLSEAAKRKTMAGGGLQVHRWMKADRYAQSCLGLQLQDAIDQEVLEILRPVFNQELPWPWIAEADPAERSISFRHRISEERTKDHPMRSVHQRMVDMLKKVIPEMQTEDLRPALQQLMEGLQQGVACGEGEDAQVEATSKLALSLIGCRIIAQRLRVYCSDDPWASAAEAVKAHAGNPQLIAMPTVNVTPRSADVSRHPGSATGITQSPIRTEPATPEIYADSHAATEAVFAADARQSRTTSATETTANSEQEGSSKEADMAGFHVCPRHHEDYSSTPKNTAFRSNAKTQGLDPPSSAMTSPIFQQDGSPVGAAVISMDVQPHDRAIAAVSADAQPLHTSVLQPGTGLEKAVFYPAMAVLHVKQPASTSTGMVAFPAKGQSVSSEASFLQTFPQDDGAGTGAANSVWSSAPRGYPDVHSLAGTTASSPSRRFEAGSQTSICFGAEAYSIQSTGAMFESEKVPDPVPVPSLQHPALDEQLKEMCALIQAMQSQQEGGAQGSEEVRSEEVRSPTVPQSPCWVSISTVLQPKSEVIAHLHDGPRRMVARSASGDIYNVPAPAVRRPLPPDSSPPAAVRLSQVEAQAWSGGFGAVAPPPMPVLQEPSGPQQPVLRHHTSASSPVKPGPIVSGELRPQVIDQREPEVALSPCSEHRVDDSHPRHGGAEPGHVEASENSESSQVVLELQQLREQVKLINEALSPEALQKQVLSVLPSLTPLQAAVPDSPPAIEAVPPEPVQEAEEAAVPDSPPAIEAVPPEPVQEAEEAAVPDSPPAIEVMPASRCQDADKDKVPVPDEEVSQALAREMAKLKESEESRLAKLQAELEIQNEALSRQMSQNEEDMARRAQQMSSAMEKNLEMLRGSAERAAQQAHEVILRSAEEEMRRQLELKAEQREMRWRAEHRELELKAELNEMRLKASRKALQQLEESELLRDSTEGTLRCDLRSDLRSDRSMPRSHLRVKQALHYAASAPTGEPSQDSVSCRSGATIEPSKESLDAQLAQRIAEDLAPVPRHSKDKRPRRSPSTPTRPCSARSASSVRSAQAIRTASLLELGAKKRPQSASAAGRQPVGNAALQQGAVSYRVVAERVAERFPRWYDRHHHSDSHRFDVEAAWFDKGQGRLIRGYRG